MHEKEIVVPSIVDDLMKGAIEYEENAYLRYEKLAEKAVQANIRSFLATFANYRKEFRDRMVNIMESDSESGITPRTVRMLYLQATEHLYKQEKIDLTNLQSVLLFISKSETEAFNEFKKVYDELPNCKARKSVQAVLKDKEKLRNRADTLYHDFIETSY